MFVILGMASMAVLTQLDPVNVAAMARRAQRAAVLAAQNVFGVNVMVEAGGLPQVDAMTGLAFFTQQTFMAFVAVIVLLVAADAGARGFLVIGYLVTGSTLHVKVLARQRKARRPMVKLGLFPIALIVAISAFGTQRPLVHIILAMAYAALRRRLAVFLARHVALVALQRLVLATQQKIGLAMIELLFVEMDHLRLTPLMLRVTVAASLRFEPSVKTRFGAHVNPHFLVAIGTQARLRGTVELDMTLLAVVFQFGMPLDQLARGQDGLDTLCAGKPWQRPTPHHQGEENCTPLAR